MHLRQEGSGGMDVDICLCVLYNNLHISPPQVRHYFIPLIIPQNILRPLPCPQRHSFYISLMLLM